MILNVSEFETTKLKLWHFLEINYTDKQIEPVKDYNKNLCDAMFPIISTNTIGDTIHASVL